MAQDNHDKDSQQGPVKKKRPSWMSSGDQTLDAAPEEQSGTGDGAPGGSATATVTTRRTSQAGPLAKDQPEYESDPYEVARAVNQESTAYYGGASGSRTSAKAGGVSETLSDATEWVRDNKLWAILIAVGLIIAIFAVRGLFSGPAEEGASGQSEAGQSQQAGTASGAGSGDGPVEDTGLSLSSLQQADDGTVTLESGELSWKGEITSGEEGETLTLEGPTVAEFERGFVLPRASISSGVFAVAQDDGPTIHVDAHTYVSGETEITQGSIFAVEDDSLTASGYYRDERQGGSEEVIRTYMNPGGENYRVSFESPPDTPVPMLIGWRGSEGNTGTPVEGGG